MFANLPENLTLKQKLKLIIIKAILTIQGLLNDLLSPQRDQYIQYFEENYLKLDDLFALKESLAEEFKYIDWDQVNSTVKETADFEKEEQDLYQLSVRFLEITREVQQMFMAQMMVTSMHDQFNSQISDVLPSMRDIQHQFKGPSQSVSERPEVSNQNSAKKVHENTKPKYDLSMLGQEGLQSFVLQLEQSGEQIDPELIEQISKQILILQKSQSVP